MNLVDLQNTLQKKLETEFNKFKQGLLKSTPQKVLESAYEYISKSELIISLNLGLDDCLLNEKEINALLLLPYPLDYLYQEWLDYDSGGLDNYIGSNTLAIEKLIKKG